MLSSIERKSEDQEWFPCFLDYDQEQVDENKERYEDISYRMRRLEQDLGKLRKHRAEERGTVEAVVRRDSTYSQPDTTELVAQNEQLAKDLDHAK